MFKQLGIFVLVAGFLSQMFSSSLLVLNYAVNQEYIIENFCVNKAEPEMKCDGRCHLSKQIEADAENHGENPQQRTETVPVVLACNDIIELTPKTKSSITQGDSRYSESPYFVQPSGVFHPPQG